MSGRRTEESAARIEQAAMLWAQDKSHVEMAAALGISRSAVAMMISRNRERFPERPDLHAAERQRRIDLVLPLWPTGMSVVDIADKTKLPRDAVYSITKTRRDLFPPRGRVTSRPRKVSAPSLSGKPLTGTPSAPPSSFSLRSVAGGGPGSAPPEFPEEGALRVSRIAAAFRPLAGAKPAALWQACGCKWPVHADETDPLTTPTLLVCNAAPMIRGRTAGGQAVLSPYCPAHQAMASGEAEWRAARAKERRAA
jgi:predicted DNA-binding protein YlxM (UPF0122 family)